MASKIRDRSGERRREDLKRKWLFRDRHVGTGPGHHPVSWQLDSPAGCRFHGFRIDDLLANPACPGRAAALPSVCDNLRAIQGGAGANLNDRATPASLCASNAAPFTRLTSEPPRKPRDFAMSSTSYSICVGLEDLCQVRDESFQPQPAVAAATQRRQSRVALNSRWFDKTWRKPVGRTVPIFLIANPVPNCALHSALLTITPRTSLHDSSCIPVAFLSTNASGSDVREEPVGSLSALAPSIKDGSGGTDHSGYLTRVDNSTPYSAGKADRRTGAAMRVRGTPCGKAML